MHGSKFRQIAAAAALIGATLLLPCAARAADICPRGSAGSDVPVPPDLYSKKGILHVALNYQTTVDQAGRTLFCFQTPDGLESPTLHVNPGDTIVIDLTNVVPDDHARKEVVSNKADTCGDTVMTDSSTNMHFHGVNTSPKCHSDEVIHTLVNSGEMFTYRIKIPLNEPPGLYWYHPHVHGISSAAVQGGASGAIIVEGIENIQPIVAGLPQRLLIIRDQPLQYPMPPRSGRAGVAPFWDVDVNYVPVPYPDYPPSVIRMTAGSREFWRVVNAGANTILDLQVVFDGKPQPMQVVAFDGVPTGSQDGKRQGTVLTEKHILLPPAARVEFVIAAPAGKVADAKLVTRTIDGGPASDSNPKRPLAQMIVSKTGDKLPRLPERSRPPHPQRFEDIDHAKITAHRHLYFWETSFAPKGPAEQGLFYIVVKGQDAELFDPNNPPAITTTKGAVEDWTIENHTLELHEFHIHQIHFKLLEVNGKPVPKEQQQWYDTYQVGYWDGVSKTYPSIKVRMDFRGAVAGDFVYHCHILDHEDAGMMAIIRVLPKG
jgi:FtsP/CotA-like multicopper oxidase with cupredoxin domain